MRCHYSAVNEWLVIDTSLCRMGSALLSRFDLVFILLDKPDEVILLLIL